MGNIGDSISDSAPAVGTSGPGYATTINSLLTELKARLIAKIPLSSLLTNEDLDLNGQALLNAAYVTLANEGVSPVASPVNRIAAYDGDIWWVSPSGAVQLTDGATLNAAGVGGITGDYSGAGPMEFRYDTANTRYDAFANQSTNTWAYVRARGFDIAAGATSAFRARLAFGGAANYTYTFPAAPPASAQVVTMDAAGAMAVDGVLGANQNITLSGTGEIKHGDRVIVQDPLGGVQVVASIGFSASAGQIKASFTGGANASYQIPLRGLKKGDRVKTVKVYADSTLDGAVTVYSHVENNAVGSPGTVVTQQFDANGHKLITFNGGGYTLGTDEYLSVLITSGVNDTDLFSLIITYDRP